MKTLLPSTLSAVAPSVPSTKARRVAGLRRKCSVWRRFGLNGFMNRAPLAAGTRSNPDRGFRSTVLGEGFLPAAVTGQRCAVSITRSIGNRPTSLLLAWLLNNHVFGRTTHTLAFT